MCSGINWEALQPISTKTLFCDKRTRFSCTLKWVFGTAHPFRMPLKQEIRLKKLFPNLPLKITSSPPQPLPPGVTGRVQLKPRGLSSASSLQVTAHTSPVPPDFRVLWSKWARLRQEINTGWKERKQALSLTANTSQFPGSTGNVWEQMLWELRLLLSHKQCQWKHQHFHNLPRLIPLVLKLGQKQPWGRRLSEVW